MKKNPKKLEEACQLLRSLRDWTQIESGLERENERAAQVWREVNDWARGAAMKLGLDLNLSVSQQRTSPSGTVGRERPEGVSAAIPSGGRKPETCSKTPKARHSVSRTATATVCR